MMRRLFAGGAAWLLILGLTLALTAPSIAATTTTFYLSSVGNPTAPLDETPPSSGFFLGRLIQAGGSGSAESSPVRYQAWHTSSGGITIAGDAELRFWGAMLSFDPGNDGRVVAYLIDCDAGKTACTTIATGSVRVDHLSVGMGNWSEQTLDLGTVNHTITKNRKLGVKLIVDESSSADLWMLYGTTTHPSRLLLDTVPTTTTTTTTTAPPSTTSSPLTTTTTPPATTAPPPPTTTSTPPGPTTTTTLPTTTTVAPTTTTSTAVASTPYVTYPPQSPPTTTVYAAPGGETAPSTTSTTAAPGPPDTATAGDTQNTAAPVRSQSPFSRQTNPGPDTVATESQPEPASATFLLTPERRNGGLTPTRVLGVVFHLIVENLNFNLLPALLLGAITTWFTMRGVRGREELADEGAGAGWVV